MKPSAWEALFFLLALKVPLVFVGIVVWRAVRAVPDEGGPDEADVRATVADTPPSGPPRRPRRPGRRPPGRPPRRSSPQRSAERRTLESR